MDDRMAAMSRMAGGDPASMMKDMANSTDGPKPLSERVDALADNPEFARELEALLAKYEGNGEEKGSDAPADDGAGLPPSSPA